MIYLDYTASTPVTADVEEIYIKALRECYANPSALHSAGVAASKRLAEARFRHRRRMARESPGRCKFAPFARQKPHDSGGRAPRNRRTHRKFQRLGVRLAASAHAEADRHLSGGVRRGKTTDDVRRRSVREAHRPLLVADRPFDVGVRAAPVVDGERLFLSEVPVDKCISRIVLLIGLSFVSHSNPQFVPV